jgi:hypothetical protein
MLPKYCLPFRTGKGIRRRHPHRSYFVFRLHKESMVLPLIKVAATPVVAVILSIPDAQYTHVTLD